ncbi:hypothetical protein BJX63DRAFT_416895 [Aspergillus granulosus]|uniref:Mid2 domain-containing protein n=1 Tax=Aspergillus granulosus TaxID=176169 RepID=A0ABR4GRD4_9EURO
MSPNVCYLLNILVFCSLLSAGFNITYPQSGDTVSIYHGIEQPGITMTWTYNATDDITIPLSIYYIEMGPRAEEVPSQIWRNVNITLEEFNIQTDFGVAPGYLIRVVRLSESWSVYFDLSFDGSDETETKTVTLSPSATTSREATLASSTTASTTLTTTQSTSVSSTPIPSEAESTFDTHTSNGGLGTGAKVGIGLGIGAAIIIGVIVGIFVMRLKRRHPHAINSEDNADSLPHNNGVKANPEARIKEEAPHELDGTNNMKFELPGHEAAREMVG